MKICIIGSGISGLSAANLLSQKHEVQVYEHKAQPGGLIKCTEEEGNVFHRVGGHVFNSKNKEVLDWFWSFFNKDEEFLQATRNAKIFMNNDLLGYPLENYIYKLPAETISSIIDDLLTENTQQNYANFAEFLEGNFGKTLYELYFKPYNEKIWNTDLEKVPLEWLEGKLPMPNVKEIILNNILKKDESNMVHATFYYPKNKGSQFIVNRLLENINVSCSTEIKSIRKENDKWIVNHTETFDAIIYTGDIRKLGDIIELENNNISNELKTAESFLSNGTSNVLCYTEDNDISWLYFPENEFIPHRIIYTGNFSPNNNGSNRKTCVVEFSGKHEQAEMLEEIKKMPGNLEAIAFNYEPNSYVINTFDTRATVNTIKNHLSPLNFHLLGRFAEWEYYNMDKCIEAAFEVEKKLS